ncbi:hypothetical protein D3C78_969390 [compost metagenome]
MPQQPQGTQHILAAHPEPKALIGNDPERALNHRNGLTIGNALRGILQVIEAETQATAQALGVDTFCPRHLGQGLQQKR